MRHPLAVAEANNWLGEGALTDAEIEQFTEVVEHLRVVVPASLGKQWTDAVFSGDGYVAAEFPRSHSGLFLGYRGVRKTAKGYAVMSGDERGYEGLTEIFSRFEDAVKGYAAEVISAIRWAQRLGMVSWMWNGTVGRGVAVESLNPPYDTDFRFFLRDDPSVWVEGSKTAAAFSHGLTMPVTHFIAATLAHPPVTAKDTTAWPKTKHA
jgi:hypothetical protein